jgi:hypothetical protein
MVRGTSGRAMLAIVKPPAVVNGTALAGLAKTPL